jgi:hypothetical protein
MSIDRVTSSANRDAFLGARRARRAQGHALQVGLAAAVDRGGRVYQRFVLKELVEVEIREQGGRADTDAGGAGDRLCRQGIVDPYLHFVIDEISVDGLLQPGGNSPAVISDASGRCSYPVW